MFLGFIENKATFKKINGKFYILKDKDPTPADLLGEVFLAVRVKSGLYLITNDVLELYLVAIADDLYMHDLKYDLLDL